MSSWWFHHSQVGVNISLFEASHHLVFLWGRPKDNRQAALVFLCMACAPEIKRTWNLKKWEAL